MIVKGNKHRVFQIFDFINIINLDAALVILFWTELICNDLGISPNQIPKLVFFFCTWLGYSADRFLEIFGRVQDSITSKRHLIFRNNKKVFILVWFSILVFSIYLSVKCFSSLQIFYCLGLLVFVILNQFQSLYQIPCVELMFPKNIRTSLILSLTCCYLPFFLIKEFSSELIFLLIILGVLFWINCSKIKSWENSAKYRQGNVIENYKLQKLAKVITAILVASFIISFSMEFFFTEIGFVLTILILAYLDRSKLEPNLKRVLLDQVYWMIPSLILLLRWL
ncbi:MAG: hypothetical protein HOI70_12270 [Opitutae bacterium]|nr:hypothetical protein [Opitutae bacterium]